MPGDKHDALQGHRRRLQHSLDQAAASPRAGLHRAVQPVGSGRKYEPRLGLDKIAIGVTYDSDLNLAKKLIKQVGLDLAKDPEFAPLILEPLKMQGVD
jgi:hypothetical protein